MKPNIYEPTGLTAAKAQELVSEFKKAKNKETLEHCHMLLEYIFNSIEAAATLGKESIGLTYVKTNGNFTSKLKDITMGSVDGGGVAFHPSPVLIHITGVLKGMGYKVDDWNCSSLWIYWSKK